MHSITVLSPHRDDAAFSLLVCMRAWSALPANVTVINFFTESAWAPYAGVTQPAAVTNIRKREDRRVLHQTSSSIRVVSQGLLDAPIRLSIAPAEIFQPHTAASITGDLLDQLSRLMRGRTMGVSLAPLALGEHVDHLAVRNAAIGSIRSGSLGFYEDLPYALWTGEEKLRERVKSVERQIGRALRPVVVRSKNAACEKRRIIAGYRSQITGTDAAAIAAWSRHYGSGERIWIPAHASRWQFIR